jgi:periplasmic divalent cation tolerance protein
MKASDFCIITTTTDSKENADAITKFLLEQKLVACVQSSSIQSVYHWQGKMIRSKEIFLQLKTKKSLFKKIQMEIEHLHTYDVPEIIMLPLEDANSAYLQWIEDEILKDFLTS